MPAIAGFGARFAADMSTAFGGPRAPAAEVRELRQGPFTVMEVRCDVPDYGRSAAIPAQDALLVALQLRANSAYDTWEDGKRLDCQPVRRGMVNILDLRRNVVSASAQPFHALTFAVPLHAVEDADDAGSDLEIGRSRTGLDDQVIQGLGTALLPALERPESAPPMFVEYGLLALRAHLIQRFGGAPPPRPGGLSPRHLKRAQDFIEAHLGENIPLGDLAARCSLSAAHFARAFRRSTGLPPHRFLVERRVARARALLMHTKLPVSDIAAQCGFTDQSHLTRVFRRVLGLTPGSLRANTRRA